MKKNIHNKTHATKLVEQDPKWFLVDAEGKLIGRMSTKISRVLMGKHKPNYVPYLDMGDHIVVINAAKVEATGNKEEDKLYQWHTGFPSGFREVTLKEMRRKKPNEIIRHAVWGMMPKTRMGKKMMSKLHIFAGDNHKYSDRKLEVLDLS